MVQNTTGQVYRVQQMSGRQVEVLSDEEVKFHARLMAAYKKEYDLQDPSDRADLDRLLLFELQAFRLSTWLLKGRDYDDLPIPVAQQNSMQRQLKELNGTISSIKNDLGMNKAQRDSSTESVASYLSELRKRAKEFGIHREDQLRVALVLANELKSIVETYDRSNEKERGKTGIEKPEHILDWIRERFIPEFTKVDEHFRQNAQRFWVGKI